GGEWISSVEVENMLMGHPDVVEAAVIGVPDEKWDERPLACVVLKEDATATPEDLRAFLDGKVARWWLPERWTIITEIPKTRIGKCKPPLGTALAIPAAASAPTDSATRNSMCTTAMTRPRCASSVRPWTALIATITAVLNEAPNTEASP